MLSTLAAISNLIITTALRYYYLILYKRQRLRRFSKNVTQLVFSKGNKWLWWFQIERVLLFMHFNYEIQGEDFLIFILLVLNEVSGSAVVCLSLILEKAEPLTSTISSLSFSLSSPFVILIMPIFCSCSMILRYSVLSFSFFFLFGFSFRSFYWHFLKLANFSLARSSLLINPLRHFLFLFWYFFISRISFRFFPRVSISVYITHLFLCLSTFFIKILSILITTI